MNQPSTSILAEGPDRTAFDKLASETGDYSPQYNLIPVWRKLSASLHSPLSLYQSLHRPGQADSDSILLESGSPEMDSGRFSIICPNPRYRLEVKGHKTQVLEDRKLSEHGEEADPLNWIESFWKRFRVATQALTPEVKNWAGLYGYFGYDTVRLIEDRLEGGRKKALTDIPDICLMLCTELIVLDHKLGQITLMTYANPEQTSWDQAQSRLDQFQEWIQTPPPLHAKTQTPPQAARANPEPVYQFERTAYERSIERIKSYTRSGDCMQVVLGGVFKGEFHAPAMELYRSLRASNPSPYMYYLNIMSGKGMAAGSEFQILGTAPEELVRLDDRRILIRPLAGTRKRGGTTAEDQEMERDMLSDPKEIAEHVMLVDLARNDIGRVADIGSVQVADYLRVERFKHVMHLLSVVTAQIREDRNAFDLLKATFPAGTVSGAPKVRAMEIIDELEPMGRGLYGGGVGRIDFEGNISLALALRTAVIQNEQIFIGAGGGIVADSIPELEWKEVHNKARAICSLLPLLSSE
ncbi:MAG: anthranilate synthase component I family protein [Gammaproteobacteria bacterium]